MTDPRRAELVDLVQRAGCNRLPWPDLAEVGEVLRLEAFTDLDDNLDPELVERWAAKVLPERRGPSWEVAEHLAAASGSMVQTREVVDIDLDGVTTESASVQLVASLPVLILGYPTQPQGEIPNV